MPLKEIVPLAHAIYLLTSILHQRRHYTGQFINKIQDVCKKCCRQEDEYSAPCLQSLEIVIVFSSSDHYIPITLYSGLILALALAVPAFGVFLCPSSGIYKDPISCKNYYRCGRQGDTGIKLSCGEGQVWNHDVGVCDLPYKVNCEDARSRVPVSYDGLITREYCGQITFVHRSKICYRLKSRE